MSILQQKNVIVGGEQYVITQLPAMLGLTIQFDMERDGVTPQLIQKVICSSVIFGSSLITDKVFDSKFAGKYADLMDLFQECLVFNFTEDVDGEQVPLEEKGSDE